MTSLLNNKNFQTFLILFIAVLIFFGRQLDVGLSNYDDAYYAQKAKEIFSSESLWVATFNGYRAFDNPPLPFWLTALAYKVFGVSGYAAVFFPAMFGAGIVVLTYRMALHLFRDNWTALGAVFVLLFPGPFVDSARRGMLDIPLAFFVTAAMFGFVKGLENKKFYLLFGAATAGAILTKSLLGFFPVVIAVVFFLLTWKWKEILNPFFLSGILIAIALGGSWHIVNWIKFGDEFIKFHFGYILLGRGFSESGSTFYFLGYAKDFLKNYWPWLPFAVIGLVKFAKKGFWKKEEVPLLIFLWAVIVLVVMSAAKTQTLRYILMIFPALALVTAKTFSEWLSEERRERCLPYMAGIILLTVLFVNATPFQVKVTLGQNS
ncbi:MAG: glycosyltransferase family 39 protein, partial [Nitrospinaceae bacterium]